MSGFKIFAKAIDLVVNNRKAAMQIVLVPCLIALGVSFLMFGSLASQVVGTYQYSPFLFVGTLIIFVIWLWIAVAWHRFILLSEYPIGWVPAIKLDRIGSYFGHGLLLGLAMLVVIIPAMLVIFTAASGDGGALGVAVFLVLYALATVLFYRLSPILPAAAIGKRLSLKQAWAATKGHVGTFVGLFIALSIFGAVIGLILTLLGSVPLIGPLLQILFQVFSILLGVSVLSTIYGHFIDGRPLD